MPQRVLVTGASGFTGMALCRRLRQEDREVVALVRASSDVGPLKQLDVECRTADIADGSAVDNAFEAFDRVYHVAAAYRTEHADRDEFRRVNVDGTRHLLEAALQHGVGRFVHVSTVGVQGEIDDPPADEDYRFNPGDHYQETKLEGEQLAREYFADRIEGVVVRPAGIYGPGDRRFLKLFRLVASGKFVMIGDGKTLYHMTYVDDLTEGIVRAGTRDEAVGQVFTIGGARFTTLWELVDLVGEAVGCTVRRRHIPLRPVLWASAVCEKVCLLARVNPPLYPRRVEFFQLDRAFTIDRARRLLDFEPAVSLEEGLKLTAQAYRDQGLL